MKTIKDYPDYSITKTGKVWSRKGCGRFLRPQPTARYLHVNLRNKETQKSFLVHRLVLETFVGPCPKGMQCRHLDGKPTNNDVDNLCWGTHKENQQDRKHHGTSNTGVQHPMVKLRTLEVFEIRQLYKTGQYTQRTLAKMFHVTQPNIEAIVNYKTWKYI